MKNIPKSWQLWCGAALAVWLGGCNTITQSPIVFTSRQTVGVDIRPTPSETNLPGVAIGVRSADFAWVPAVGVGECAAWKSDATSRDKMYATRNWADKCETTGFVPRPLIANAGRVEDIFSVFGQFDSKLGTFKDGESSLSKVFAVGLAASRYTEQAYAKARQECLDAVDAFITEKVAKSTVEDVKNAEDAIALSMKAECTFAAAQPDKTKAGERK